MAKKKQGVTVEGNTISGTAEGIVKLMQKASARITAINEKAYEIKSAALKDDFCNYGYELKTGPTAGDSLTRSGASIVHDDLKLLFKKLHVHLAVICEEIDKDDVGDIERLEDIDFDKEQIKGSTQDRVTHFTVTSFSLTGSGENENVVLTGHKRLSTGDYVNLKSPKVHWNGGYDFINELRVVVDDLKAEVEEYMNGKSAPKMVQTGLELPDPEDEKENDE